MASNGRRVQRRNLTFSLSSTGGTKSWARDRMALSLRYGREFLVWAKKLQLGSVWWLSMEIGTRKVYLFSRAGLSANP